MSARTSGASLRSVSETPLPSRLQASRPRVQHALALAVLAVALAAVFPEIALQGRIFASPDYEAPSYFAAAGRAALRAGEYPLWNPYLFTGMPSFASLAFTPYVFPLSEVLSALGRLPGAPPLLWLLVYYLVAGYGTFLLLRSLSCEFWAAVLGGLCFMLTPHLVSMGVFGHGSKLASVAVMPYTALLTLRLRQPGRRLVSTALLGLALGLQFLRGHPQVAFYGLLMLGLIAVVELVAMLRRRTSRDDFIRFAAGLGAGVVLGAALAAVLLLPVRAYAPVSIRGAGPTGGAAYEYATNWSFSMREIATFFQPAAAGFGEGTYVGTMPFTNFPNYLGQAALVFGFAALLLLRGRVLVAWCVVWLLALVISFGRNAPFAYDFFYRFVPYFNRFRVPVMIQVLLQLATAVLVGFGLTALWGRLPRELTWRRVPTRQDAVRLAVAAAVLALLAMGAALPWGDALAERVGASPRLPAEARGVYADVMRRMLRGDAVRIGVLLLANAGVVLLLWRRRLHADVAGAALCLLTVVDLGVVNRRMVQPEKTWPGVPARIAPARSVEIVPTDAVRWLQAQPRDGAAPVRILSPGPGFMDNVWMAHGIAMAGGYHPAKLARFETLVQTSRQTLDAGLADLFAVRYFVVSEQQGDLKPDFAGQGGVVYANPGAQPRAWVTGRWELLQGEDCGARLRAPQFDRRHTVLLETAPVPAPDSSATGSARITAFTSNRVEVEVTASAPALLVLAEAFHPDWRARIGAATAPVWPADCVLRTVPVPAGTSHVVLTFTCPPMRAGLVVTSAAGLAMLVLLGFGFLRRGEVRA